MLNERGVAFNFHHLLQIQRQSPFIPFGFSSKTTLEVENLFIESNRRLANRFPEEFHDFARAGWRSKGQDMTDRVGPERLIEILAQYVHLATTEAAAPSPSLASNANEFPREPIAAQIASQGRWAEAAE